MNCRKSLIAGASRHTASLSFPSIVGGVAARCATAVVLGGDVGGAGETDWNTITTAASDVSGIMIIIRGMRLFFGWYDSPNGWFRDSLPRPPTHEFPLPRMTRDAPHVH